MIRFNYMTHHEICVQFFFYAFLIVLLCIKQSNSVNKMAENTNLCRHCLLVYGLTMM